METQRAHIVVPADLLADIDSEVGPRGRSAFFTELARQEINKRKLLALLRRKEPMWKPENHPEMAGPGGVERWVRALRDESDKRVDRAIAAWND
jgi:hypothetical protein